MVVQELPVPVGDFAGYLGGLLGRVDPRAGWCGVFWRRDPDGMRACVEGREVPPWDVVEDLLHDLAAAHGAPAADRERGTARALHARAAAAYDARPGGREALRDRLETTLREEREAAERLETLRRPVAPAGDARAAEALRADLAWARADHERAVARAAELRDRLEALAAARRASWETGGPRGRPAQEPPAQGHRAQGLAPQGLPLRGLPAQGRYRARTEESGPRPEPGAAGHGAEPVRRPEPGVTGHGAKPERRPEPGAAYGPAAGGDGSGEDATAGKRQKRKRPRGSARFAGMPTEPEAPTGSAAPALPGVLAPVPEPAPDAVPRGARFAGAADQPGGARREPAEPDAEDRAAVTEGVARLLRLRGQGRSGEAHALLAEMARWPVSRLPLAAEWLEGSGGEAEWATLLWEASSLPVPRLVPVADALAAAGRPDDGERVLRQGVARPAEEMADAVAALCDARRDREVRLLMDAYVRTRVPAEAARCAAGNPARMVPLLLEAARGVSQDRYWDVVHALRVAGVGGA
ncbi:hypothetical protein ABT026_02450 [Streptomyces sp. NPDC002734]|uniref:hypothetical protein n=1 Tax=Streptomyces sp. NPDC002734 TaxID=3154426 RepID=UPI00332C4B80